MRIDFEKPAIDYSADRNEFRVRKSGTTRLLVNATGAAVTGTFSSSGAVTVTSGGLTVTAGGLVVTAGGLTVTAGGLTVTAGGLTVTAGNAVVTAGNLTVTAGILTVTAGGAVIANTGAGAVKGLTVTNAGTLACLELTQTGNVSTATLLITQTGTGIPLQITPNGTTLTYAKFSSAANGASLNMKLVAGTHTMAGGGLTETISNAIPAGSMVLGVTCRVTTAITMTTGVNFDIGFGSGGDLVAWGTNVLIAQGTTTTLADAVAAAGPKVFKTATSILLTADAGTFSAGGVLRYNIYYYDLTAPTS